MMTKLLDKISPHTGGLLPRTFPSKANIKTLDLMNSTSVYVILAPL